MSRYLVDENLSPTLASALSQAGHEAVHVNQVGLQGTPDQTIMGWAARERRAVITADHDFHDHLLASGSAAPSVVRVSQRGPDALAGTSAQAERLGALLPGLEPYLGSGIAVAVDRARLSITPLPLSRRVQRLPTAADVRTRAPSAARVLERVRERVPARDVRSR